MKRLHIIISLFVSFTVGAQDMTSPKAECETLMNSSLSTAKEMLQKHGEFYPYGAAMKLDGEIISIAGYDGRERPPSMDIIRLLKEANVQGAKRGDYKATALIYDVKIQLTSNKEKTDAIAIALDHKDNYSVVVFYPYRIQDGKILFDQIVAQKGAGEIFQ